MVGADIALGLKTDGRAHNEQETQIHERPPPGND